jgi:DNA-binding LacI/PurR family transcriptional regulator
MLLVKEEPLYLKLKNNLKKLIENKNLKVLPGTKNIEKGYGVSRITVRRAIAELANEGIVTSMQGRKVMVTKHMYSSVRELGFVTSSSLGWGEHVFADFANEAISKDCNFNMFICGAVENTAFTYLLDSNKLSALLMMSKLPAKTLEYILKKKIPLLTYDLKYKDYDIPAALFSYKTSFSQMFDYYLEQNIDRFGFISFYENDDDPASGKARVFVEDYKKVIAERNLLDYNIPDLLKSESDYNEAALKAIKYLHGLNPAERPQVISTCFFKQSEIVKSYLEQINDWKPLHIYYKNEVNDVPRFIYPYKKLVEASFAELVNKMNTPKGLTGDILVPIKFDHSKK